MRLLDTKNLRVNSFDRVIPPYVILSHTWGDYEVTFDDIHQDHAKRMEGYRKILKCCEQAVRDGYDWAWVFDLDAIDFTSLIFGL